MQNISNASTFYSAIHAISYDQIPSFHPLHLEKTAPRT